MPFPEGQGCDTSDTVAGKAADMAQALDKGSASGHMHPFRGREEPPRLLLHVQQREVPEDLLAGQ